MVVHDVITFGETMIRLSTTVGQRLEVTSSLDIGIGGAESNLAVALARLGRRVAWSSVLPRNPFGERIAGELRRSGVDVGHVRWVDNGRVGVYFLDSGAPPRPTQVIYDRSGSAVATADPDFIDPAIVVQSRLLHLTGITPALSRNCAEIAHRLAKRARDAAIPFSFDVNYRSLLWTPEQAAAVLRPFCAAATVLICGRQDAEALWSLNGSDEAIARALAGRFGAALTVLTLGEGGALAVNQQGHLCHQPPVPTTIVDRIGAGDAFAAGFLHGYLDGDIPTALRYGVTLAALKMTITGDLALVNQHELEQAIEHPDRTIVR